MSKWQAQQAQRERARKGREAVAEAAFEKAWQAKLAKASASKAARGEDPVLTWQEIIRLSGPDKPDPTG